MFGKKKRQLQSETKSDFDPAFPYILIRDQVLERILGENTNEILYWAGKQLARQNPVQSFAELQQFSQKAGFGALESSKTARRKRTYQLTGGYIDQRLQQNPTVTFTLEAGFFAQQTAILLQQECEGEAETKGVKKQGNVVVIQIFVQ